MSFNLKVLHHGAITGVTGSCHQYISPDINLIIDCGLFQGNESHNHLAQLPFNASQIDALIITHAHIDHSGRIPWLIANGFKGPIFCSEPTAQLLPLLLEDTLEIHLENNKALVTLAIESVCALLKPLPFNHWQAINNTTKIRLQNAGHILGSAYVEIDTQNKDYNHRTVFSGDIGAPGATFVGSVKSPEQADLLVLESTYGDRLHSQRKNRKNELAKRINLALQNNGSLLIPSFSLGRTQELIAIIGQLLASDKLIEPANHPLPVILDSPLAEQITQTYKELSHYWTPSKTTKHKQQRSLAFDQLIVVNDYHEHKKLVQRLAQTGQPAIIIAASGMCQGGRILDYLEALISKPETDLLFVGYQAEGTLGHQLQNGKPGDTLTLGHSKQTMNASSSTISGFSAHADQKDLINFVEGIPDKPQETRLVHGSQLAKQTLANKLYELGFIVNIPSG